MTRLTVNLPPDVWRRLNDEAASKGLSIGAHAKALIIARDERMQSKEKNMSRTGESPA